MKNFNPTKFFIFPLRYNIIKKRSTTKRRWHYNLVLFDHFGFNDRMIESHNKWRIVPTKDEWAPINQTNNFFSSLLSTELFYSLSIRITTNKESETTRRAYCQRFFPISFCYWKLFPQVSGVCMCIYVCCKRNQIGTERGKKQ